MPKLYGSAIPESYIDKRVMCSHCKNVFEIKPDFRLIQTTAASPVSKNGAYFNFDRIVTPQIIKVMHVFVLANSILITILMPFICDEILGKNAPIGSGIFFIILSWLGYFGFRVLGEYLLNQIKIKELLEKQANQIC